MLMGMVVFGTYDGLVHAWNIKESNKDDDGYLKRAPIWVHSMAGAASGVTRSLFWVGWERFVYDIPHTFAFSWRTTIHHAIGHGVLFGGYYGCRTILMGIRGQRTKT